MNWLPNRKVVSGFVAGGLTWLLLRYTGESLDPAMAEAAAFLVTTVIGYFVPLPEEDAEKFDHFAN